MEPLPKIITIGDKYRPAMKIITQEEALEAGKKMAKSQHAMADAFREMDIDESLAWKE